LNVIELFPTPVALTCIGREFTVEELSYADEQRGNVVGNGSLMGANGYILEQVEFEAVKKDIESALAKYMSEVVQTTDDVSIYITQSWLNYAESGSMHPQHIHPNSFLSGVLYIKAVLGTGELMLYKPLSTSSILINSEVNKFTENHKIIRVKTGDIVIFPSTLLHSVQPQVGSTRISLAFNTFLKGTIGTELSYAQLKL